jgi:hypothetical protein
VSRSCACIGSLCLRHCVHGASIGEEDVALAESLTAPLMASATKWVRPLSVSADALLGRAATEPRLPPLGKAGVAAALRRLGWGDGRFVENAAAAARVCAGAVMVKTIALIAHETELVLCVLQMAHRLQVDGAHDSGMVD